MTTNEEWARWILFDDPVGGPRNIPSGLLVLANRIQQAISQAKTETLDELKVPICLGCRQRFLPSFKGRKICSPCSKENESKRTVKRVSLKGDDKAGIL